MTRRARVLLFCTCHADGLPLTTNANSIPITADDNAKPAILVRHASPGGSYRADSDPDRSVITLPPGAAADKPGKRVLRGAGPLESIINLACISAAGADDRLKSGSGMLRGY